MENQNSSKPFQDPFKDISSEDKTKLIILLKEMLSDSAHRKETNNEIHAMLNALQERLASYKDIMENINAITKITINLKEEIVDIYQKLNNHATAITNLQDTLINVLEEYKRFNSENERTLR